MSQELHVDWQEVVDRNPKGYWESQDLEAGIVVHGPIESIVIDESDFVIVTLKWAAKNGLPSKGTFKPKWQNDPELRVFMFPNLLLPFVFEEGSRDKGERVRAGLNILYLNEVSGIDPANVIGLDL